MFKLNSGNGKFDIIFTGDPTIDTKARENGKRATSAGRRKNDEWKSHVFHKIKETPTGSKVKETKASKLRLEKERKVKAQRKIKHIDKPAGKTDNKVTLTDVDTELSPQINDDNSPRINNDNQQHAPFKRKQTYTFQQGDEGFISQSDINDMIERLRNYEDENVVPTRVPGLDLENEAQEITKKNPESSHLYSPRQEEIRRKQATPVEDYNPWGRPGAGAPIKQDDPGNIRSQVRKNEEIRCKQATPVEDYNPWGRPGAGAPIKQDDPGNIRSQVRKNVSVAYPRKSQQEEVRRKQDYKDVVEDYNPWGRPGAGAPIKLDDPGNIRNHIGNNQSSWRGDDPSGDPEHNSERSPVVHSSKHQSPQTTSPLSFARGKGRPIHELEEGEKRRLKEMEHQKAIAEQVELKRIQKRLDKEKQWKEELEVEERFKKENEISRLRYEEEQRQRQEKEEARRLQQEQIEESIRKAAEEALKAKEEAKKSRYNDHRESPRTSDNHLKNTHKLHDEDEQISKYNDDFFERLQQEFDEINELPTESVFVSTLQEEQKPKTVKKKSNIPKPKKTSKIREKVSKSIETKSDANESDIDRSPRAVEPSLPKYRDVQTKASTKKVKNNKKQTRETSNNKDRIESRLLTKIAPEQETEETVTPENIVTLEKIKPSKLKIKKRSEKTRQNVDVKWSAKTDEVENNENETEHVDMVITSDRTESKKTKQKGRKNKTNHSMQNDYDEKENYDYDQKKRNKNEKSDHDDHYLVPFHRSKTESLIQEDEEVVEEYKRPHVEQSKSREQTSNSIVTEHLSTPDSPTRRQQEILQQLQALRQGLLHKRQEHTAFTD